MGRPGHVPGAAPGLTKYQFLDFELDTLSDSSVRLNALPVGRYRDRNYAVFVDGIFQSCLHSPQEGWMESTYSLVNPSGTHSVYLEDVGSFSRFDHDDYIPKGGAEDFEAALARKILFSWKASWSVSSPVGDTSVSGFAINGASRGHNCEVVDGHPTRARLHYSVTSVGGNHYIRLWNGESLVAEGSRSSNGGFAFHELNNSGISGTATLNYSSDVKPGTAYVELSWPSKYEIHYSQSPLSFPRAAQGEKLDDGGDEFQFLTDTLADGTYYWTVLEVSDGGVTQTTNIPATVPVTLNLAPEAPRNVRVTGTTQAPLPLDHFAFDAIPSNVDETVPFSVTIRAKDAGGATYTSFTGTVALTSSSGAITPTTSPSFVAGVATFTVTPTGTGSRKLTATASGKTGTSNAFTVNALVLHHFVIDTIPSPQPDSAPFSVTIRAKDSLGRTVTTFTGTVSFYLLGENIMPPTSGTFVNGVRTETIVVGYGFPQSGVQLTVTSSTGPETGTSNAFDLEVAQFDHWVISPIADQTSGVPFGIVATAYDQFNNPFYSYSGAVNISTNASGGVTPSFDSFSGGIYMNTVTLFTSGTEMTTITIQDSITLISATSNIFTTS